MDLDLSRRQFLGGSAAWIGLAAAGICENQLPVETVSIFFTTDLHGHITPVSGYGGHADLGGIARCATYIREAKQKCRHSLLVDIGDVYQGTAESFSSEGRLMIGLFNLLGYDAWALGNHDFDWGREVLESNLALSKSPIVTGNIQISGQASGSVGGSWKNVVPWTMKEVAGIKIALVGLTTPGLPYWVAPETLGGVGVVDPALSLRQSVIEAKLAGANAIVLLGHMGHRSNDDFANPLNELFKSVQGVDVLLAGHTHQNQASWQIGPVLCSQASYHGIHCGKLDLTFDRESKKLIGRTVSTTLMDRNFALDPAVMEKSEPALKQASEQLARKVATVIAPVEGKGRGSKLAKLFCEIFAEALGRNGTPVDGIFHGTFGTAALLPGELTVRNCWEMIPFENLLTIAEVSAQELIEIVREDSGERSSDRTLWPFDLRLDFEGRAERFSFKGMEVASDRRFKIGFNSYDAQSGGQRLMKLRDILANPAAKRVVTGIDTRGALIDGLLNRGNIS